MLTRGRKPPILTQAPAIRPRPRTQTPIRGRKADPELTLRPAVNDLELHQNPSLSDANTLADAKSRLSSAGSESTDGDGAAGDDMFPDLPPGLDHRTRRFPVSNLDPEETL
jgi:hypothetical protein